VSQQINLFNPAFEEKRKLFGATAMAQALVVLVLGVIALSWYGSRHVAALQARADDAARMLTKKKALLGMVATEFAPREPSQALAAELGDAEAQLASLHRIAAVIDRGELGNATGYSQYFQALARQHVEGLWLTGLAITGAGCDIGVRGRAVDAALLPGFLGRLTQEKIMQGKSFGSLQISQPEQAPAGKDGHDKDAGASKPARAAPYLEFSLQSKPEGAQS
jgi:Tfp pilus assembly protein PilN